MHTWYLSQTPQTCLCKKKLPGVNFYRFNAKNWRFFYRFNAKKLAFFGVNFILQKIWLCKKDDKYKVWSQIWDQSRTPVHFPAMCTSQCTNLLLSFYAEPPLRKGSGGRPFLCVSTVYLLNVPSFSWTALQNCCMNYYNSALISLYVSGKTFLTYLSMKMLLNSDLITSRWHQIVAVWAELNTTIHEIYILHVEKLSGFAKTFQSALLTRWRGFSDSGQLLPDWLDIGYSGDF